MRVHPLLLSILAVLPGCSETFDAEGCISVDEETTTCPAANQVSVEDVFLTSVCGDDIEVADVKSGGRLTENPGGYAGTACCYTVEVIDHDPGEECVIGRPFLEGEAARVAPVHLSYSFDTRDASGLAPGNAFPDKRASAWLRAGAAEHASVAAFGRLSLQLMALGAPLDLIEGVQRAALDEVHHTRACWKVAADLSGASPSVGRFPFERAVDVETTLADLAHAAVREGCLAETLGACVTQTVAPLAAQDVRAVLVRLADEEATHAVLSFRIVSWALQVGGRAVREAVQAALAEPWPTLDTRELAVRAGVSLESVNAAARAATVRVLEPATRALLS